MAPTFSEPGQLGSKAPHFLLPGVDGKVVQLSDFQDARVLVVAFICNHCPYVIATQGRVNQLAKDYLKHGVRWVGINSNDEIRYPEDNFEKMKARSQEQGFVFPYLRDETQEVARAFGAVCTPEFYVYLPEAGQWILKYQGRLDDSWKDESKVTQRELANAIEALLAGRDPSPDQKPAIGCSIKWKQT
jgi:peroxiredoxin